MKYEDALKKMRRGVFVYNATWRTAVICPSAAKRAIAWDEARYQIEASSLKLVRANFATSTMELERGAIMRFFVVQDDLDTYKFAGNQFAHIMVLQGDYPVGAISRLRSILRSAELDSGDLLFQEYVTL